MFSFATIFTEMCGEIKMCKSNKIKMVDVLKKFFCLSRMISEQVEVEVSDCYEKVLKTIEESTQKLL